MNNTIVNISDIELLSPENMKSFVLPRYGISPDCNVVQVKFKNTDKQRSVYKVETKDKAYCLKKVYYPVKDLLYIYSAVEWLYRNGIKVPRILSTVDNSRYVIFENMLFILTPWIDGEKCDFDNIEHVNLASLNLGMFHNCLTGFMPILGSSEKVGLDDLSTSLHKHCQQLNTIEKQALKYDDYFSKIYILNFTPCMSLANLSDKIASTINTKHLTTSVCHNDYVSKNLIMKNKSIYVIDFDKCRFDYCALDIGYCMRRLLRRDNTNWNVDLAIDFLQQYERANSLTLDDYKYIISYLSFPQKYWKISRDYYKNIAKCNKKSFVNLLNSAVADNKEQIDFTMKFADYIQYKFQCNLL